MTNRKAALFMPSLSGGGAERVMVTLANGLSERGVSIDFVLATAEGDFLKDVSNEIRVVGLNSPRVSRSFFGLVRYLRKERPDVLLSALNHANIFAVLAIVVSGVKTRIVVAEHNNLSRALKGGGLRAWIYRHAMRLAYLRANAVVTVSHGVASDLIDTLSIPSGKVTTIYNPIVTQEVLSKADCDAPGFPQGSNIIAVGRLTKQKDYPNLLSAFSLIKDQIDANLIVLGEGEQRGELEAMVKKLGIEHRVSMPGFVANPYAWMRRANLFVLSSAWEGLPTVLVEAMACGTPVVSTDCPSGPAEILEGGSWGELVPVGDHVALADAMAKSLASPRRTVTDRAMDFAAPIAIERYLNLLID